MLVTMKRNIGTNIFHRLLKKTKGPQKTTRLDCSHVAEGGIFAEFTEHSKAHHFCIECASIKPISSVED